MLMNHVEAISNNNQRVKDVAGATMVNIELCKVEVVNSATMTLDVLRLSNAKKLTGVPFCTPVRLMDKGMIVLPEIGAVGILATTAKREFFVIGFLSYANSDSLKEVLTQGEMLFQSSGYGFLKMDDSGNLLLSSSSNTLSYLNETESGNISINLKSSTAARDIVSGIINNVVHEIERCYDKDISTLLSPDDLVNSVLLDESIDIIKPTPVLEIQKGNVVDDNYNIVKLQIFENENPDACYSIKVLNNTEIKMQILIGKDGSVQLIANKLQLECNVLDLKNVKNFTPNMFAYDGYEDTYSNIP